MVTLVLWDSLPHRSIQPSRRREYSTSPRNLLVGNWSRLSGSNGEFLTASALNSIPGEVRDYHGSEFAQAPKKISSLKKELDVQIHTHTHTPYAFRMV